MPDLKIMHASMQFSDTKAEHRSDTSTVFRYAKSKGVVFLTGTEGGGASLTAALTDAAKVNGFHLNLHKSGEWVAVNLALAKVTSKGWDGPLIPGTKGVKAAQGAHSARGIAWTTADVPGGVGSVTVGSIHYLTQRSIDYHSKRGEKVNNQAMAAGVAKFGKAKGAGKALVFINGDVNLDDQKRDVWYGAPFTTIWDELKKWPGTMGSKAKGRTIDVSASWNADGRVSAKSGVVLDDSQLRLATDHFPLVAVYTVKPIKKP